MPPLTTAKAYAASLSTGLAAALAAALPGLDGFWLNAALVVLAVLAAYGVTYAVPNATPSSLARRRSRNVVDDLIGEVGGGEPPA